MPVILLLLLSFSAPLQAAGAVVAVEVPATIKVGEVVPVPVKISEVTGLYGFEIQLKFDPAVVRVADADPAKAGLQLLAGDFLALDFLVRNTADNQAGTAELVLAQLNPSEAKSGAGTLFTVYFEGVAAGKTSAVTIQRLKLASRDGLEIAAVTVNGAIAVTTPGSQAQAASPTPLPTAVPPVLDMDVLTATPQPTAPQPAAHSPTTTPLPAATATPPAVSSTVTPSPVATAATSEVSQPATVATASEPSVAAATAQPTMPAAAEAAGGAPAAAPVAATAVNAAPTATVARVAAQGPAKILDAQPQPAPDAASVTEAGQPNRLLLAGGGLIALASVAFAGILILRGRSRQP